MKNYKSSLLFILFFSCLQTVLHATHIVGGVLSYQCLGYNSTTQTMNLRITMYVYRDAINGQAAFDNPAYIGIYVGTSSTLYNGTAYAFSNPTITTLPIDLGNPCLIVPPNVRVEQAIYTQTLSLPYNAAGYTITYQRCCRNNSINNLSNPGGTGSTYNLFLSGRSMTSCNSSPVYRNFPPIVICKGEALNFDHSATDANGHRLEYRLCRPYDGASAASPAPNPPSAPPYTNIVYSSGFSANYPIATSPAIAVNLTTGLMTGTPTQIGQYVVGVCVTEYDAQGNLLSETLRDFQFNVTHCENQVTALLQADSVSADSNRFYFKRCGQTALNFVNTSRLQSFITGYRWNFSNGFSSTLTNPSVTFGSGTFTGTLIANPGSSGCTDTAQIFITLYPAPVIGFNQVIDSCNPAHPPIQFNSTSTVGAPSTISSFNWNFGDGGVSSFQNPTHSYTTPGTYTVNFNITTNHGCLANMSRQISYFPAAAPAFTIDDNTGCVPHAVQFTNGSTPFPASYTINWNFGDGTANSSSPNPAHTYLNPGTYNPAITVTSPWGCRTTITHPISVFTPPTALFSVAYDSCLVDTVRMTDASSAVGTTVTNWNWAFADGNTSTTQHAHHLYQLANTYNIQLVITDGNGCKDTANRVIQWYPAPIVDITNPTSGCAPFGFTFNNQSHPLNGYTTAWTFGDGGTSNIASPSHTYLNPGQYFVSATMTSLLGCRSTFRDTIQVRQSPNAQFVMNYNPCVYAPVSFNESSTPNAAGDALTTWRWIFGDGGGLLAQDTSHQYTNAGNYNVQLIVTDINGCQDTMLTPLAWFPSPIVTVTANDSIICQNDSITFTNTSFPINGYTMAWTFGDGGTSTAVSPTHPYLTFGTMPVHLHITSPIGCVADYLDTILVHQLPNASFFYRYDSCAFDGVEITDNSTTNLANDNLVTRNWTFGDGGTATNILDTIYPYAPRQDYRISLRLTDINGCVDTVSSLLHYFPAPVFPVPGHSQIGCVPQTVNFDNNPLNNYPGYVFNWNFGNGTFGTTFDTNYVYTQRGTYYPRLVISTPAGCIDTFIDTIRIYGVPFANLSYSYNACDTAPVTFRNLSQSSVDAQITTIAWDLGDGSTSALPLVYHTYHYPDTGVYTVNLRVTDGYGCTDDTTVQVLWNPYPIFPLDFPNRNGCIPLTIVTPTNNPYPVAGYTTQWAYGDGTTSNQGNPPNHTYTVADTFYRSLIIVAPNGCTDTFRSTHIALPVPIANFSYSPSPSVSIFNALVQFTDASIDAAGWEWHFGLGRISDYKYQENPTFTYQDTGLFNIQLVAKHLNGCTDTAYKVIDVVPQYTYFLPNAFTPNDDGKNDDFRGNGLLTYITTFQMDIYNRWGERIFTTNSPEVAWNGRKENTGKMCQAGVYVVVVHLKGPRGEEQEIKGFATLVN